VKRNFSDSERILRSLLQEAGEVMKQGGYEPPKPKPVLVKQPQQHSKKHNPTKKRG
jgi:hypothetical protein